MRWGRAFPVPLLAAVAPPVLNAQSTATGAFIVRLGSDTIFVEQYVRTAGRLEGDQISRVTARTTLRHFVATLDAQGNITRYEVTGRPAGDAAGPLQRASMTFTADSATVQLTVGDSSRTVRVAAPAGTIPYVNSSYALIEILTQRAHTQTGGDPALFQVLPIGAPTSLVASVQRLAPDTVLIMFGEGNPARVQVDGAGRVLGATGLGTTEQVSVERVPSVDIPALARSFAQRPLALLSPPDSVHATIAGATVAICYSRPTTRGRMIFGGVVPWNQVWRTGANAPTSFRTSADLVIGGKTIHAGAYTLFTVPNPDRWTLIINQQTGPAAARYDSTWDVARIDMRVRLLPDAVDQLTISIAPQGRGGMLTLAWETTEVSVPFTVSAGAR